MIPKTPEDLSVFAGEYVLGLLEPNEAREVAGVLATNTDLRKAVAFWEQRLFPLSAVVTACDPPSQVWAAIEAELDRGEALWSASTSARRGLRWSTSRTSLAALVTGLLLYIAVMYKPVEPILIATLHALQQERISWIATVDARGLVVRAVTQESPPDDHAFELWVLPEDPALSPRSVGMLPASGVFTSTKPQIEIDAGATLAISIEPLGGSPSGAPTGPVVFIGGVAGLSL